MELSQEQLELENRLRTNEQALITALTQVKRHEQMLSEHTRAMNALNQNQEALLSVFGRNTAPFVAGGPVLAPVGKASDFWDPAYATNNPFYTGEDLYARLQRDQLPVPDFANNEGYTPNGKVFPYWVFGLDDYLKAMEACKSRGIEIRRVYDFGGSTGRVFRQFYCQDEPKEVWSSDFKESSVNWCLRYLPSDIRVFLNTYLPQLPISDNYFDLVTAYSVFTHIDELETAWLLELKRILRPGGVAYLTIHDETTWQRLTVEPQLSPLVDAIRRAPNGLTANLNAAIPDGRAAFHFSQGSHYNSNVFHSQEYIRANWGRFFEIAEIIPTHHWEQAVVICINR